MPTIVRSLLVALAVLLGTAVSAADDVTRAYCETPGQDFMSQCAGLDPAVAQAECDAKRDLARQRCAELERDWLGAALEAFDKHKEELVTGAVTAVASAAVLGLAFLNTTLRQQVQRFKLRLADPFIEKAPVYQSFAVNAMVVGLGGAGKTSIIRALSASDKANPATATAKNALYSIASEVTLGEASGSTYRRLTRIFLSDHVGQDTSTILQAEFYTSARLEQLPKCLIIVVDLFAPGSVLDDEARRGEFDLDRIEKTKSVFTAEFTRPLTAPLNPDDRIILFINKIDVLSSISSNQVKAARQAYVGVAEMLRAVRGAELSIIVGSAEMGWGIVGAADDDHANLFTVLSESAAPVRS